MANWLQVIRGARGWHWARAGVIAVVGLALLAGVAAAVSTSQQTWMVSNPVPDDPLEGVADGNSLFSNISYTGRWVAFESQAANLTGDSDSYNDIFLYENYDDTENPGTRKETFSEITLGSNASSYYPTIARTTGESPWDQPAGGGYTYQDVFDGRFVSFESTSSQFSYFHPYESDPLAGKMDVFLYDRGVSTEDYEGLTIPGIYTSQGIWAMTPANLTANGQAPNGPSGNVLPLTSVHNNANGAHIAGNPLKPGSSVYLGTDAEQRVVFESLATNLVSATLGLTPSSDGQSNRHIYVRTGFYQAGTTPPGLDPRQIRLLSKNEAGVLSNGPCTTPAATSTGRYVAMVCKANNLVDGVAIPNGSDGKPLAQVYLLDRDMDGNGIFDDEMGSKWYLVSRNIATGAAGADESWYPTIAEDGIFVYVGFHTFATNLVDTYDGQPQVDNQATDVFVFTMAKDNPATRVLYLGSRASGLGGAAGNYHSYMPSLSADGRAVAYTSLATNLVVADNNEHCGFNIDGRLYTNCPDVFIRRFKVTGGGEPQTWRASLSPNGVEAYYNSAFATLSGNSRFVGFSSYTDLRVDQQLRPSQLENVHIYIRDMSETSGNPNIQPSSGYFYAFPGDSYEITFTLNFFESGLQLSSAIQVQDAGEGFSVVSSDCGTAQPFDAGDSCTVTVRYEAPENNIEQRHTLLAIPFTNGYTRRVALFGSTIMRIFPLVSP